MADIAASIGGFASQNPFLAYFIIYIVTIFLGNISAFASFWFVFEGYMGAWGVPLLILTLFIADLSGDLLWYTLGKKTRDTRFGNWIKRRGKKWHDRVEIAFENNGLGWIILSKFMYAAAFPVIFSAGWMRMGFRRFLKNSLISIFIWLPILLGLAYGLVAGLSPLRAVSIFKNVEILFISGLVIFLVLDYFLAKILTKTLDRKRRRSL